MAKYICSECGENEVDDEGDVCDECQMEHEDFDEEDKE